MYRQIILASLITGCTYLNPAVLREMASFDPLTVDPSGIAVEFDLPEGVAIRPDTAALRLEAARSDTGQEIDEQIRLQGDGEEVWRIHSADHSRMIALQSTISSREAEAPDASSGSLSITLEPCLIGDGPEADARVSARLQTRPNGPFLPFIDGVPLSRITQHDANQSLSPCP